MLAIFLEVVLPAFIVAALGALLLRLQRFPTRAVSQVTMYLFAPALIFVSLLETEVSLQLSARILALVAALVASGWLVASAVSTLARHPRGLRSGFALVSLFPNAGNMGLPLALFGFGEAGFDVAIVFFVVQALLGWTLGVFLASRSRGTWRDAVLSVARVPTAYGAVAALVFNAVDWTVPATLLRPLEIMGNAAIPGMLMVLGFQLAAGLRLERLSSQALAIAYRLVASAAIAYGLTSALGITGVAQQTLIVIAAMPPAVFTTILATEFDAAPGFVSTNIVAATLISLASLTILINLVQRL